MTTDRGSYCGGGARIAPQLLDGVECGEAVVITRRGRAIAPIVPAAHLRQAEIDRAIENIKARQRAGKDALDELLSARHREGHKH
jgi:antitoxin (DNA-binding transcriptional repressor) of toxin-antitoxin stability system